MNANQLLTESGSNSANGGPPLHVSAKSRWTDTRWIFETTPHSQREAVTEIDWNFSVGGGRFCDRPWAPVLESLRWVLWCLLRDPYGGNRLKETSVSGFAVGVRSIVRWMDRQRIFDLGKLSPSVCREYVDDCIEQQLMEGDGQFTYAFLYRKLHILEWIHTYTPILKRRGLPAIERAPFGSETANSISRAHATKECGKTGPLPDLVAIPIMNRALKLIGRPAEDVIALNNAMLAAREMPFHRDPLPHAVKNPEREAMRLTALDFEFATLPGESAAWRRKICGGSNTASYDEVSIEVRALIYEVINAAIITILSQTGMRVNELCKLRAGAREDAKIPGCVEIRKGYSGLNDTFFIQGLLVKGQKVSQPVEWIAGLRPKGSSYIPPVVVAIGVLERLIAPWRKIIGSDRLLVRARNGFIHQEGGITRQLTTHVRQDLRIFAQETPMDRTLEKVALFAEEGFTMMKTAHWRFTWAHFVFKTDPRLLREISVHFKHLALRTTEFAYIGNDAELLETLNETRLTETTRFFYEATTGRRIVTGSAGFLVEEHRATLQKLVVKSSREASDRNIRKWVESHDLRIWFFLEGKCLMNARPDKSRCHQMAGTTHWSNRTPNYSARSCDLCMGCSCFSVDDDHEEAWVKRYEENRDAFQRAVNEGRASEFRVAKARMEQAKGVLARITR